MGATDQKQEQRIASLWTLVEPVIQAEGMELIEVEFRREPSGWVLRLYIDLEGGIVSVNDCARISQVVGDLLDVADPISTPYHLEVSSPGLDRPLRKWEHFQKNISKIIDLRTTSPLGNRRRFKGVLVDTQPGQVTMNCDGQVYEIPLTLLERARLCYFESGGQ